MSNAAKTLKTTYEHAKQRADAEAARDVKIITLQELIKQLQVATRVYTRAVDLNGTGKLASSYGGDALKRDFYTVEAEVLQSAEEKAADAKKDLDEILSVIVEIAEDSGQNVLAKGAENARNNLDNSQQTLTWLAKIFSDLVQWLKNLGKEKQQEPQLNTTEVVDVKNALSDAVSSKDSLRNMAYGDQQAAQNLAQLADEKAQQLATAVGGGKLVIFSASEADAAAKVQIETDQKTKTQMAFR